MEQGLAELLGIKTFCVPHFFETAFIQPPQVPRGTFKQFLIGRGKGCATREKQSSETIVQPWGKALDTPIYFADTKTPSRWEMLMINDGMCPQHVDPRPAET